MTFLQKYLAHWSVVFVQILDDAISPMVYELVQDSEIL